VGPDRTIVVVLTEPGNMQENRSRIADCDAVFEFRLYGAF